jgi:hypothetical protein
MNASKSADSAALPSGQSDQKSGMLQLGGGRLRRPLPYVALATYENERVRGIEPPCAAWEAAVLPLNYTRVLREVNSESFRE